MTAPTRPAAPRRPDPLSDFVGPARRRTDHPIVVGTIILCLGITTISALVQVGALLWMGDKIAIAVESEKRRDVETAGMRATIILNAEKQENILRRLCLNSARTLGDQQECLTLVPPISPRGRTQH